MTSWSRSDQNAMKRVRHPGAGSRRDSMMSLLDRICRITGHGTNRAGTVPLCGVPSVHNVCT
jgi:hypothetical protein